MYQRECEPAAQRWFMSHHGNLYLSSCGYTPCHNLKVTLWAVNVLISTGHRSALTASEWPFWVNLPLWPQLIWMSVSDGHGNVKKHSHVHNKQDQGDEVNHLLGESWKCFKIYIRQAEIHFSWWVLSFISKTVKQATRNNKIIPSCALRIFIFNSFYHISIFFLSNHVIVHLIYLLTLKIGSFCISKIFISMFALSRNNFYLSMN